MNGEQIKKYAPVAGGILVLILLLMWARSRSSASAASTNPGGYSVESAGTPDNSRAQIEAGYNLGVLGQQKEAFLGLLDYRLGSQKIATDAAVTENTTAANVDVTKYLTDAQVKLGLDKQTKDFITNQVNLDYSYRLGQGQTNAAKNVAKTGIIAGTIGNGLKLLAGLF